MSLITRPADTDLVRGRFGVAGCELTVCSDGAFRLDGGAMFGVVPKTLWSRRTSADDQNRVVLGTNCVVVRTGHAVVLIETGIGNKQPAKMRAIHENQELLPASLAAAGVDPREVTHVLNTHLHFDHCGWNTTLQPDRSATPTFPNARYFCAAGELAHGRLQLDRDRVSYQGPNCDPLIASGQLTVLDPDGVGGYTAQDERLRPPGTEPGKPLHVQTSTEIAPGISVEAFPGHTDSMLAVHLHGTAHGGASEHACYISDLIPTHHHLEPTWVMGFDLDPLRCIAERKRFLARAIPEQWLVLFTHDHELPAAYLQLDERGKPAVRP